MSETVQEQDQDQTQDDQAQDGDAVTKAKGLVLDSDTLNGLHQALGTLQEFPNQVPEGFTLSYAELDGTIGKQSVQATFEDGKWAMELGQGEGEGGSSEQEDQ